jgi:hypothetical protein
MTPDCGVTKEKTKINTRNFRIEASFAKDVGATTL